MSGSTRDPLRRYLSAWIGFSAGGSFSQALTVAILLYSLGIHTVRSLIGWPGSVGVLVTLVLLAGLSLFGARHRIEWRGILPVSLLAMFGYLAASVFWSQYTWVTAGGVAYAFAFGGLGMYIALGRDLVQVIRATGDCLRILLTVSLSLEVLSGILIDQPFPFLGIQGNLAEGGPIQGVAGTRNFLGFLAALALITFAVEWFTRSITQPVAIASSLLALTTLFFASSPITSIAVLVLVVAAIALRSLRRAQADRRPALQTALLVIVLLGGVLAFVARNRLLGAIGATSDVDVRLRLWSSMRNLIDLHSIVGWGFTGQWQTDVFPFTLLTVPSGHVSETGLGAFFDTWMQLGLFGLLIVLATGTLAFARAWLTASDHPIVAYVWPALVLVLIGVTAVAESFVLFEGTLMTFVAIATIAARKRSWRSRLPQAAGR